MELGEGPQHPQQTTLQTAEEASTPGEGVNTAHHTGSDQQEEMKSEPNMETSRQVSDGSQERASNLIEEVKGEVLPEDVLRPASTSARKTIELPASPASYAPNTGVAQ